MHRHIDRFLVPHLVEIHEEMMGGRPRALRQDPRAQRQDPETARRIKELEEAQRVVAAATNASDYIDIVNGFENLCAEHQMVRHENPAQRGNHQDRREYNPAPRDYNPAPRDNQQAMRYNNPAPREICHDMILRRLMQSRQERQQLFDALSDDEQFGLLRDFALSNRRQFDNAYDAGCVVGGRVPPGFEPIARNQDHYSPAEFGVPPNHRQQAAARAAQAAEQREMLDANLAMRNFRRGRGL